MKLNVVHPVSQVDGASELLKSSPQIWGWW